MQKRQYVLINDSEIASIPSDARADIIANKNANLLGYVFSGRKTPKQRTTKNTR
jgi:hypothetical protein